MKAKNPTNGKKKQGFLTILKKNWSGWMLLLPAALILYFFVIRTTFLGAYWSFFNMKGFKVTDFVGLENYRRVITDMSFLKNLWNTVQYVLWSIVLGYPLPIILAVLLNEAVHLRKTFRFIIYFPGVLPGVAVSLLWFFVLSPTQGGLFNQILSIFGIAPYGWLQDANWTIFYIILSMTWSGCGGTAIYYFAALQGVSRELYEAAIMDGAGFFKRFWVVTLPHIYNISLLFLVRQIIGVFSVMDQVMQMTDGGPNGASMTLGLQIYRYAFVDYRPQFAMALGVIMFFLMIGFTIFYFYMDKKLAE